MPKMPDKKYRVKTYGKVHNERKNWLKDQTHSSFYNSRKWRRSRLAYIMANPVCVQCGRAGKFVDHIVPISDGGAKWNEDNWQTLCVSCNASKTAKQKTVTRQKFN